MSHHISTSRKANFIENDAEREERCDFLVIGGGCSGCVIARRLSDAGYDVILCEAGPDPLTQENNLFDDSLLRSSCLDPLKAAHLWGNSGWMMNLKEDQNTSFCVDYAFATEPESALNGRAILLNSGRCLGGGSSINNGLWGADYIEPDEHPWKEWEQESGFSDWGPVNMVNSIARALEMVQPRTPVENDRMKAFDVAISDISLEKDTTKTRVKWCIDGSGNRVTAASVYLNDKSISKRLRIMTNTRALKLIFNSTLPQEEQPEQVQVVGAVLEQHGLDQGYTKHINCFVSAEVLVCCGSILTPSLLLHSGIGPRGDLELANVECIVDSPNVGKNLIIQPSLPLFAARKETENDCGEHIEIPECGPVLQSVAPVKAPLGKGTEAALFQWNRSGIMYAISLCTPKARGWVKIPPVETNKIDLQIHLNVLTDPDDVYRMMKAASSLCSACNSDSNLVALFGGYVVDWPLQSNENGNQDLIRRISMQASSTRHPMGTCRMGYSISDGVCDSKGRVFLNVREGKGFEGQGLRYIKGIRCADNSLIPSPPSDSHVMRIAFILGERISELILQDYEEKATSK